MTEVPKLSEGAQACIDACKYDMAFRYILLCVRMPRREVIVHTTSYPGKIVSTIPFKVGNNYIDQEITYFVGKAPLQQVFGYLTLSELLSIFCVCKQWRLLLLDVEDKLFRDIAIMKNFCRPSSDIQQYGFTSWKHYLYQRYYDQKNPAEVWETLVNALPPKECIYAVFNYPMINNSRGSLIFISWTPHTAKVQGRLLLTNMRDFVIRAVGDVKMEILATRKNKLAFDNSWAKNM